MKYPCRHIYAVTKQVSMNMFGVRWHSQFQHYYGRDGAEDWTAVFDLMMADEFERDNKNGEVINIEGMDFLSQQPESWLSIQDDNNTLVAQGKHLHELTWVQKKVAVKGVPLPEIRRTVEAALRGTNDEQEPIFEVGTDEEQEPMFEVECHIPDTIHNLQVSQQNAVTSLRHQKNAADAQVTELFRTALNLAGQRSGHIELLKDHLQEVIRKMNSDIASGNKHHKRSSGYAFPETGRSNKRVEKCWRVLRHPRTLWYNSYTTQQPTFHGLEFLKTSKYFPRIDSYNSYTTQQPTDCEVLSTDLVRGSPLSELTKS
ncbi:hypothetical protein IV203_021047 [Nitzschia inconspicua]|uniref:Uncharacterized protein n=1 Tax=Nitzschia inconspicua TaxID=303405 RepID=A0A9K3KGH6_9STRA|nr:hypothetical protein IV203_021047 [Nitzschia inconspicua]